MLLFIYQLSRDVIGQVNNQSLITSTDVIHLTLTLKMTTAQVVETSVTIQDYVHLDDQTQPTYERTLWVQTFQIETWSDVYCKRKTSDSS